jgi:hypothetical protein
LLAEICSLKDRGLTAEAVVANFVFKNIQPLKDRVYPAYLYTRINDSTRVANRQIPNDDLLSQLDMILRGRVSNAGAPSAYSAWNLPSNSPFSEFVSNPPARDGSPGYRVRPSPEDIEALIAPFGIFPRLRNKLTSRCHPTLMMLKWMLFLACWPGNHLTQLAPSRWQLRLGKSLARVKKSRNPKVPAESVHVE